MDEKIVIVGLFVICISATYVVLRKLKNTKKFQSYGYVEKNYGKILLEVRTKARYQMRDVYLGGFVIMLILLIPIVWVILVFEPAKEIVYRSITTTIPVRMQIFLSIIVALIVILYIFSTYLYLRKTSDPLKSSFVFGNTVSEYYIMQKGILSLSGYTTWFLKDFEARFYRWNDFREYTTMKDKNVLLLHKRKALIAHYIVLFCKDKDQLREVRNIVNRYLPKEMNVN